MKLLLQNIKDKDTQDALRKVEDQVNADPFGKGQFQFFTYTFAKAVTALKIPHSLGFMPTDVIQLSITKPDTATVTWKYDSFTVTNIVVTTSAACTVRAYIGRYGESQ